MILLATRYWFPIKDKLGKVNRNLTWTIIFAFGLYTFGGVLTATAEEIEGETTVEIVCFDKVESTIKLHPEKETSNRNVPSIPPTTTTSNYSENVKKQPHKLYILYCQMALDKNTLKQKTTVS